MSDRGNQKQDSKVKERNLENENDTKNNPNDDPIVSQPLFTPTSWDTPSTTAEKLKKILVVKSVTLTTKVY